MNNEQIAELKKIVNSVPSVYSAAELTDDFIILDVTNDDKTRNLNDLRTIIAQHEEIERLRGAIVKINNAGTYGSCENAITDAVNMLPKDDGL